MFITHHASRTAESDGDVQITYLSQGHHAAFVFRALSENFTPVFIPKHPVAPTQWRWFEEKVEVVKKRQAIQGPEHRACEYRRHA
jgi:hypothetical protein